MVHVQETCVKLCKEEVKVKFRQRMSIVVAATTIFINVTADAQNRRTGGAPRSGTITSIMDPLHVPKTLPELVTLSPLIVLVTCQEEAPSRFFVKGDFRSDVVTDRMVRIDNVLKGSATAGTTIAIEELGGGVSQYDG